MGKAIASEEQDNRSDMRYPTHFKAFLSFDRKRFPIMIRDISLLGCCLYGPMALRKGDEVVLSLKGQDVVATIAWTKERYAGANFHREIDPLKVVRDNIDHPMFAKRTLANAMMVHF